MARLILLHGYTQNGRVLAESLAPLLDPLGVEVVAPDGPFDADPAMVVPLGSDPDRGPHRTWWRATDDGSAYHGWEEAREHVRELLSAGPAGILGFSQGAMLGACVAAWSARGELPPVAFAVLVAGRVPRAQVLQPLFAEPVDVPSLHVWGARDPMASMGPELAARFVGSETLTWPGPHVVPTRGDAGAGIAAFLKRHLGT
ncbi:MAG: hypothetical protein H6738_11785 [Alphaproteobacteria bacterium]|nr:hypothetical protein [Alphaproteobacteria bacterium]MCB9697452.1 hypothetical protein [Alphaproteobacteria bacterium]